MTDQEIKDAVQKDPDNYIGTGKVDLSIHTEPNMISGASNLQRLLSYTSKPLYQR